MHAISSYCGNRHRPPVVRPPQTGPITVHCAAKLSAQCNKPYEEEEEEAFILCKSTKQNE